MAEFSQLYPVEILETFLNGSLHNPAFNISSLLPSGIAYKDPKFFDDSGSNITSSLQVSFMQYVICALGWHSIVICLVDTCHKMLLMLCKKQGTAPVNPLTLVQWCSAIAYVQELTPSDGS